MKAVSEIYSPASGEVTEVNGDLQRHSRENQYRSARRGWLIKVRLANPAEVKRSDGRRSLRSLHRRCDKARKPRPDALSPQESRRAARRCSPPSAPNPSTIYSRAFRSDYRLREALKLPGPFSEAEVIQYFKERAAENSVGYTSFLGAGVYNHLRSVVTDAIIQRGEFLTSYTPYQAEITQGTLQAIFEFQTLMCQLTGQEVANASM